ncbi:MAG: hypothetical protein QOD72_2057 [Acidimicrobiaceae bacterium]|nr:hypothetical protein [Acidimicrobiaceae bacterium]
MSSQSIAEQTWHAESPPVSEWAWPAPLVTVELDANVVETWGTADEVVAHYCRLGLSGTLRIDGSPAVWVHLHDGLVYFAERATDTELGFRLVLDGVISEDQLVRGTRLLEGGRHLGGMFANDPGIDRQLVVDEVVAYCTEAVASLEGRVVSTCAFLPNDHHSSGILAWYTREDEGDAPAAADPVPVLTVAAVLAVAAVAAIERVVPAEPVAATLSDWLGPVKLEPLVERDDHEPAFEERRLPRRSRFDEPVPLIAEAGLGEVNISALQAAMTNIRASNRTTVMLTARETAAPAVPVDAPVATDAVLGSPAERRRWLARRHR